MRSRLVCFKHIAYALISLALLACGFEVGLRVYDSYTGELTTARDDGSTVTARCWWTHHRLKPLFTATQLHPDTLSEIRIHTNSFGVRGREVAVPKPQGVFRVICLGDETTFAPETDEEDTFCGRLEVLLQARTRLKVEVLNAGVPGYCPLLAFLLARHSLLSLEPDLFVLNFDMSDVADDHEYRRDVRARLGMPLACPHPALETHRRQNDESGRLRLLTPGWCKSHIGLLAGPADRPEDRRDIDTPQGRYAWLRDDPPDWSLYIEQALSPIGQLHEMALQARVSFMLAVIPAPWQISSGACSGREAREQAGIPANTVYKNRGPFEILEQYAAERQIRFVDASQVFVRAEQPEKLYLHNAPRLSVEGHALYARILERTILRTEPGSKSGPSKEHPDPGPVREAAHETHGRRWPR